MGKKKNPKDSKDSTPQYGNWAKRPKGLTQRDADLNALNGINHGRKGKVFKLVPHPTIPKTFIEVEVK